MMNALIIVDIQNDFVTGGKLEVPHGEQIIPLVNQLSRRFELVVATQDWHPQEHKSFASNHPGKQPFEKIKLAGLEQTLWPDHCIQASLGAEFHAQLDLRPVEGIFRKGMEPGIDSYSGFFDNGHRKATGLSGYLRARGVDSVYVCGLAADYCVYYTAKDALEEKFKSILIVDATRAISEEGFDLARKDFLKKGGQILDSSELM